MEEVKSCPVCDNKIYQNFLSCKDYTASGKLFTIVSCNNCDFKFTNPRPSFEDINKYYEVPSYISHSNTKKGIINFLYHFARIYTLKKKIKLINSFKLEKSLLDYGCGTGEFLKICSHEGWKTFGIEPNLQARNFAINYNKLIVEDENYLEQLKDGSFSVITLWHVLEHVHDLNGCIANLKRLLKKEGNLLIAVPNYLSYDAKVYGKFWAAYDVPRHLYHFSSETMEKLFKKHGLYIKKILPMKFDSFYISLLSEKNKKGTFIKALFNGIKSNYLANKNCNYSSLIYIIEKHKS